MSNSSNNFRMLSIIENSSNLIQIAPANPSDTSHLTYNVQKRYAYADCLSRVKIALRSCKSDITFTDPLT